MGFFADFKKFAMRGNVVDLAVGVIIGAAFGTITKSMVDDVMMPPLGLAMGQVDFKEKYAPLELEEYRNLKATVLAEERERITRENVVRKAEGKEELTLPTSASPTLDRATKAGVTTLRYGLFINTIINFIFVAFGVFLVVKGMTKLQKKEPPPPPAEQPPQERLLGEIRDLLKAQAARR